ncbi:peptide-N4-(N-acetyl-beta-glucosaminyl)asparagine amidase A-like [Typha latifolia]|uniref:peptide-N4-(N-acetyl-beta- glucosaminyl)asparagine amidase A-like n=1 Tax=Typha latifolia TaxID=4733 RepID=UPI003C2D1F54
MGNFSNPGTPSGKEEANKTTVPKFPSYFIVYLQAYQARKTEQHRNLKYRCITSHNKVKNGIALEVSSIHLAMFDKKTKRFNCLPSPSSSPILQSLLHLQICVIDFSIASSPPAPFPPYPPATRNATLEYMDPTLPPLIPTQNPKCSIAVLRHDFANTVGSPPISVDYAPPPECPAPWSRVILELSASASDAQKDRTAALWINGAEILRTTTPLAASPGVFWRVRKDITRYAALLRSSEDDAASISMMLENSNSTLPGVYSVNVSLHFYRGALHQNEQVLLRSPTIKGLYHEPADMIIPISDDNGDCGSGYWFRIENEKDAKATSIVIPKNAYRAVVEIYASPHGPDERWYANPLRTTSSTTTTDSLANGAFRQVGVTVDNRFAGGIVPFPVIYPGTINPFFWAPVAAIGAFDHPSYDIDVSPFLGLMLDGQEHHIGLTVQSSQPFWLVSANLHLWLDAVSDAVEGALVQYAVPPLRLSRQASWRELDGKSSIDGQSITRFSGWVSSSRGNITTSIKYRLKFKSRVAVQRKGSVKEVSMEVKARTDLRTERKRGEVRRVSLSRETPLHVETVSSNGGGGSVFERTRMQHAMSEMRKAAEGKEVAYDAVEDQQESEGSALVEDGVAKWGSGDTKSMYKFRDDKGCYLRTVSVVGGRVQDDVETKTCALIADI